MTEDYYFSQLSDEEIEAQSMKGLTSADEVSQIRVLQLADQSQLQESPKAQGEVEGGRGDRSKKDRQSRTDSLWQRSQDAGNGA